MKYAIVDLAWAKSHGIKEMLEWRKSIDGTKVILHEEMLAPYEGESFPRYEFDSQEFKELLASSAWTPSEGEKPQINTEYSRVLAINELSKEAKNSISTMELSDNEALAVKELYPLWDTFIGKSLAANTKVQYRDKLYKVRQAIYPVLENQPPSISTAALYEEIIETAEGTVDDPIAYPADGNMTIYNGKYYTEDGILYLCIRDSGQPLYTKLANVVDNYVKVVE